VTRERNAYEAEMLELAKRFHTEAIGADETDMERLFEALLDNDVALLRQLCAEFDIR
jgi:hypothetical protein